MASYAPIDWLDRGHMLKAWHGWTWCDADVNRQAVVANRGTALEMKGFCGRIDVVAFCMD
jgi:hypothetical protein